MHDLPDDWCWRRVDEIGQVQIGRQLSPAQLTGSNMRPYLRVANVCDGNIDYSDVLEMNFTAAEFDRFELRTGDILLNEGQSLELVGRSAIYNGPPGFCFQNTLVRFRPILVDARFAQAVFKRWLDTGEFTKIAKRTTSIAHLGGSRFAGMSFPVPPLGEQRRIAEILDTLEIRASNLALVANKQSKTLTGLIDNLLAQDMHSSPRTRLGDVLMAIDAGWSPLCAEVAPPPGQWGVLKVSAVTSGTFLASESKTLLPGMRPRPELEVHPGDLILCRANGVKKLVGVTTLVRNTPSNLMLSDKLMRLIVDKSAVDSAYLELVLASDVVRRQIDAATSGSSGQNNISQSFVRALQTSLPPLLRQQQVVEIYELGRKSIHALRGERAKLNALKQGLTEDLLTGRVRVAEAEAVLESL